jgi:hypothetical protein
MSTLERCTGFTLRGLNADCDRLAVQSSEQTTWMLGRRKFKFLGPTRHEVSLLANELKVLRTYGGAPEIEIIPHGDANAIVIVDQTQTRRQAIRMGTRLRLTLKRDEAVVIHNENIQHPNAGFGPEKHV